MNKNWEYKKIGDVCTVERGGSPRPIDKFITESEDGINWIKIGDTTDSMYITETAQKIIPEGMKKSRYVKPGDFLLSNSMSFGRPYILAIDGCIHDGWLVLRDDNDLFDKRFLYYYLSSAPTYNKFKSMAVGGVVNNLNSEMVRGVEVPIPSKEYQSEIADLLDKLKNVVDSRNNELALLDELIKARFVEMFDDETGDSKTVDTLCESVTGGSTPSMQHPEFYGGDIPFIKSGDVKSEKISVGALSLTKEALVNGKAKIVKKGSVIAVVRSAALLHEFHIAVAENDVVINQDLKALCPKNGILPEFLLWSIKMQDQKLLGKVQTMLTSHIRMEDLLGLYVHEASVDNQQRFVDFVRQVDKSKDIVQKSLDETQKLFDSLMQEYFG